MNSPLKILIFILLTIATLSARGEQTVRIQPVDGGEGGYRAQPNDHFQWILAYYASGSSKRPEPSGNASFGIFGLSSGSHLHSSEAYHVAFKKQVRTGGLGGISAATAYLYESYAKGDLGRWMPGFSYDSASATSLQHSIWALERGQTELVSPDVVKLLMAHFSSWNVAAERYEGSSVRLMTLTPVSGGPSSEYLIYLPDYNEPRSHGMPVIAHRAGGGGGGVGGGGGITPPAIVNPPTTNPPVVEPPLPEFENIDDIVVTPPTIYRPEDDFTGSTPPGIPGIPVNPQDPVNPPTNHPDTTPPGGSNPPVAVPDGGSTVMLFISGVVLLAAGRRALRK